jgi:hypothetical protein
MVHYKFVFHNGEVKRGRGVSALQAFFNAGCTQEMWDNDLFIWSEEGVV